MTDTTPDLGLMMRANVSRGGNTHATCRNIKHDRSKFQGFDEAPERIDNISDTALQAKLPRALRQYTITKDDIFDYVYGVLHAPSYREQFANDLSKMIPRIPYVPDFRAFAEAGNALANLHLNYETCEQYPSLSVEPITPSLLWEEKPEHFRLGKRAMRFADKEERTTLIINEHVQLYPVFRRRHIGTSSTAELHWNGSSTVTR